MNSVATDKLNINDRSKFHYNIKAARITSINTDVVKLNCRLNIYLDMSADPGDALLRLELDMKGRKKSSGANNTRLGKADIDQKDKNDAKSGFTVYLYIRPEMIEAITCPDPKLDSAIPPNATYTVLRFSMLQAADLVCPHDADFSNLRTVCTTRWNQFRALSSANAFSVSFNRGDLVKKADIEYFVYLFSSENAGSRPRADERRGDIATLYNGAGGKVMRAEKDKFAAVNPPPYIEQNTHKRPQAELDGSEYSMHPAKRLNDFQQINGRMDDIEYKLDELATQNDEIFSGLHTVYDDFHEETLRAIACSQVENKVELSQLRDRVKTAFQRARGKIVEQTTELVSNIAHDAVKNAVEDAVNDILKNELAEMLSQAVEDAVRDILQKMVKDNVETSAKSMEKGIEQRVRKALMKGVACGLNMEAE